MKIFVHKVTPFSGADTATVTIGESDMKDTPYIYHLGTTAYFISSGSAESMSDEQLIHAAKSAAYCKDFAQEGYAKVARGNSGALWRKVSA